MDIETATKHLDNYLRNMGDDEAHVEMAVQGGFWFGFCCGQGTLAYAPITRFPGAPTSLSEERLRQALDNVLNVIDTWSSIHETTEIRESDSVKEARSLLEGIEL